MRNAGGSSRYRTFSLDSPQLAGFGRNQEIDSWRIRWMVLHGIQHAKYGRLEGIDYFLPHRTRHRWRDNPSVLTWRIQKFAVLWRMHRWMDFRSRKKLERLSWSRSRCAVSEPIAAFRWYSEAYFDQCVGLRRSEGRSDRVHNVKARENAGKNSGSRRSAVAFVGHRWSKLSIRCLKKIPLNH